MDILLLVTVSTYEIMSMDLVCVCVCLFVFMCLFVGTMGGEVGVGNPFFNKRNRV